MLLHFLHLDIDDFSNNYYCEVGINFNHNLKVKSLVEK